MEMLLAFALIYLCVALILSKDSFIRGASGFVVLSCAYAIAALAGNGYILYFFAAITAAIVLPFFPTIGFADVVKVALLSLNAIFWLTTAEFRDAYAFSELFVALGIAFAANLIFSAQNRRYLCLVAILLSYTVTMNVNPFFSELTFVGALCIGWVFTQKFSTDKEKERKKPCAHMQLVL